MSYHLDNYKPNIFRNFQVISRTNALYYHYLYYTYIFYYYLYYYIIKIHYIKIREYYTILIIYRNFI